MRNSQTWRGLRLSSLLNQLKHKKKILTDRRNTAICPQQPTLTNFLPLCVQKINWTSEDWLSRASKRGGGLHHQRFWWGLAHLCQWPQQECHHRHRNWYQWDPQWTCCPQSACVPHPQQMDQPHILHVNFDFYQVANVMWSNPKFSSSIGRDCDSQDFFYRTQYNKITSSVSWAAQKVLLRPKGWKFWLLAWNNIVTLGEWGLFQVPFLQIGLGLGGSLYTTHINQDAWEVVGLVGKISRLPPPDHPLLPPPRDPP